MPTPQKIDTMEFMHWANEKWVEYAACTLGDKGRLRFEVNLLKRYRVTLGDEVLYDGEHLHIAQATYQGA